MLSFKEIVERSTKSNVKKVIAGAPDRPLIIGGTKIPCYVLEDETRVLGQADLFVGVGISRAGARVKADEKEVGTRTPRFMDSKSIKSFISNELRYGLENPILFKRDGIGGISYGYKAEILVDICNAVIDAKNENKLKPNQLKMAQACELFIRGIAKVGIIALVDEATGYQALRGQQALAAILEKFIAKELQPWTKTFPYEFYEQIFRLTGWAGTDGTKRPGVIGHYTNDIVYARLAPEVLRKLKEINSKLPSGGRKNQHHQWFTSDLGHPKLKEHLAAVTALMKACDAGNWEGFKRSLEMVFSTVNSQMLLDFHE